MSVGGTSLRTAAGTRGWSETAWRGAGSGCSKSQNKPTWQKDPGCTKRFVADVSAIGDPATGVAYYDGGWKVVGGTSVSAPILAGIAGRFNITDPSWPYSHTNAFFDVTSGNNGTCGTYQCTAQAGVDGPTGIGTPNGALWTVSPDGGTTTTGGGGAGGSGAGGAGAGGRGGAGGAGGAATTTSTGTAGAGGATGSGGAGSGGAATTTGVGGATTGAGGDPTTGATTTTGSAGTGVTSGTTTATTTSGAGGSGSNPFAPKAAEDSGCSCRIGSASESSQANWSGLAAVAMGLLVAKRRRGRRV
jgi:MYXO-CTERM domain-containing protein